jgi:hypothetical protein
MENENWGDLKPVELGKTGEIELPTIDVSKYIGQKAKIEKVLEFEGKFGYFIKVQTELVDTITGGKEPIELRGSRIFGLQEDKNNNVGWGKDTNLGVYLRKMGVDHYKDLVGKEVVLQSITAKKDGKDYLGFN